MSRVGHNISVDFNAFLGMNWKYKKRLRMFLWRLPRKKRHVVVALRASQGLPALAGSTERDGQNKRMDDLVWYALIGTDPSDRYAVLFATTGNSAVGAVAKHITLLVGGQSDDEATRQSYSHPHKYLEVTGDYNSSVSDFPPSSAVAAAATTEEGVQQHDTLRFAVAYQPQELPKLVCGRACLSVGAEYRERNGKLGNCWNLEDYSWRFDMVFVLLVEHE
ncbi:hypothetical protein GE21DRAFT_1325918 [Neurospora crassa]|nr:hypothetical protein B24P11.160 [imported] - Neurospora crassa [Neurospora crassa]KHE83532.1 hypothetical protein GE21DRAFT_1325918 [Neurospora crassa]